LREERRRLFLTTVQWIQGQLRQYAEGFLQAEYGAEAVAKVLDAIEIIAIDAYDNGGISEATEDHIIIAAKRDIQAGQLTATTKLILRHELGHIFNLSKDEYTDFKEELQHEKIAWAKAKPKNAAEKWYKNLSIRTHIDPLKMQSMGFPRPETKLSAAQLRRGVMAEVERMKKDSAVVDKALAKRYAMANLVENHDFYSRPKL
jgi:hypothetical protein